MSRSIGSEVRRLRGAHPGLRIEHFDMNGADDVVKYSKWSWAGPNNRMITMCRPGSTATLRQGA